MKLNYTKEQIEEDGALMGECSALQTDWLTLHAEVERLTAELDKHRWIPVTERRPDETQSGTHILFRVEFPSGEVNIHSGHYNGGVFFDEDFEDYPCYGDEWPDASGCNDAECYQGVTHWKPIEGPEGIK